jgi:peroxiredoxin
MGALRRVAAGIIWLCLLSPPAWAGGSLPAEFRELSQTLELSAYPKGWRTPDFEAFTASGRKITLKGQRGKLVLINFWATWCPPCRAEMKDFEKLQNEFSTMGLSVMAVNVREDEETIKAFKRRLQLNYPLLLDLDGRISKAFGVRGLPVTFIVGRRGEPLALATGQREWYGPEARELISRLLRGR